MCKIPTVKNFSDNHIYALGSEEMRHHEKVYFKWFLAPLQATGRRFPFWTWTFKTSNKEGFSLKGCYVFL